MRQTLTLERIHAVGSRPPTKDPSDRAVARCWTAYTSTYQQQRDKGTEDYRAENRAQQAYKNNMPTLSNRDNVRAFVACIANGVLAKVFDGPEASKLLYAAQVALSTLGGAK